MKINLKKYITELAESCLAYASQNKLCIAEAIELISKNRPALRHAIMLRCENIVLKELER